MSITLNGATYRVVRFNGKSIVTVETGHRHSRLASPVELAEPHIALLVLAGLTTPPVA